MFFTSFIASGDNKSIKPEIEHINKVSVNTENICISPCLQGWEVWAAAAACGAPPIPASFENNPLFNPFEIVIPIAPPKIALGLNACINIFWNTEGTEGKLVKNIKSPINI